MECRPSNLFKTQPITANVRRVRPANLAARLARKPFHASAKKEKRKKRKREKKK